MNCNCCSDHNLNWIGLEFAYYWIWLTKIKNYFFTNWQHCKQEVGNFYIDIQYAHFKPLTLQHSLLSCIPCYSISMYLVFSAAVGNLLDPLAVVFQFVDCCCVRNWNITHVEEFYSTASFHLLVCCTFSFTTQDSAKQWNIVLWFLQKLLSIS